MASKLHSLHLVVGHLDLRPIASSIQPRLHAQTRLGLCPAHVGQQHRVRPQRLPRPMAADPAEQATLHGVVFRRPLRVMADRDLPAKAVSQLFLQTQLPQPRAAAVVATRVRQDQQPVRVREPHASARCPPPSDGIDRELGRGRRRSDLDIPARAVDQVDPLGQRDTQGIRGKVIGVDLLGLLAPTPAGVLEVAHQLLFLQVHADHRQTFGQERLPLPSNLAKLPVSIRMPRAGEALSVGLGRGVSLPEEFADRSRAGIVAAARQVSAEIPQAASHPLLRTHRIAPSVFLNHGQQVAHQGGRFFSRACTPLPVAGCGGGGIPRGSRPIRRGRGGWFPRSCP